MTAMSTPSAVPTPRPDRRGQLEAAWGYIRRYGGSRSSDGRPVSLAEIGRRTGASRAMIRYLRDMMAVAVHNTSGIDVTALDLEEAEELAGEVTDRRNAAWLGLALRELTSPQQAIEVIGVDPAALELMPEMVRTMDELGLEAWQHCFTGAYLLTAAAHKHRLDSERQTATLIGRLKTA